MPVNLTVRQVRDALYQGAGPGTVVGDGAPSHALLGQWFHEGVQWLVGDGSANAPLASLTDVDADLAVWKQTLAQFAYDRFVGPRLSSQRASLHPLPGQTLSFWKAMQAACDWFAELCWGLRQSVGTRRGGLPAPWQTLARSFSMEESFECLLRQPTWTDAVRLTGAADVVVRLAGTGAWCAIELKLGQTSPECDLGQACLYHLLVETAAAAKTAADPADQVPGALALVSFLPERKEQLFSAEELRPAKEKLIALIGQLAGVNRLSHVAVAAGAGNDSSTQGGTGHSEPEAHGTPPTAQHHDLGKRLVTTLAEYKVDVALDGPPLVGSTFLRFPITPGRGVKVSAVEKLAAELQVRLQLVAEPFISRDQGRLVIDVQRPDRQTVYFRDCRTHLPAPDARLGGSSIPVGVDLAGNLVCADLSRPEHAHLLVAGTTGSGKSEWLRLALAGLMLTNSPDTLRLLVIDPKRNAFHTLRGSPYLWRPLVFPDETSASDVLGLLADEMDARYQQFDGADSIAELARRSAVSIPRIVCVCDEYRDLISRSRAERREIETHICRLGAKARAAGIHLILATQEASRDTIKGALDANMPARVGLKMGKRLESTMLLNEAGAERLLGHGDLLFKDVGALRRLQAPLLAEADRNTIFGAGEVWAGGRT